MEEANGFPAWAPGATMMNHSAAFPNEMPMFPPMNGFPMYHHSIPATMMEVPSITYPPQVFIPPMYSPVVPQPQPQPQLRAAQIRSMMMADMTPALQRPQPAQTPPTPFPSPVNPVASTPFAITPLSTAVAPSTSIPAVPSLSPAPTALPVPFSSSPATSPTSVPTRSVPFSAASLSKPTATASGPTMAMTPLSIDTVSRDLANTTISAPEAPAPSRAPPATVSKISYAAALKKKEEAGSVSNTSSVPSAQLPVPPTPPTATSAPGPNPTPTPTTSTASTTTMPVLTPTKKVFDLTPSYARCFVIKSFSEDDVHKAIKYNVWASTDAGNKRLNAAHVDATARNGPVYLFFSVNASGQFCGVAQMTSAVDFSKRFGAWAQDKWSGEFKVEWIFLKDVPNRMFRHITIPSNEDKPVTNSRDTQEIPLHSAKEMLQIFSKFQVKTSILDDFAIYNELEGQIVERRKEGKKGMQPEDMADVKLRHERLGGSLDDEGDKKKSQPGKKK